MVRRSALPRRARRPVAVKSDALPDLAASGETHAHDHHRARRLGHRRRRLRHRPGQRRSRRPQATWTAALRAARTARLTGELPTVAVTIGDNHCGALYSPARDEHGRIDPTALTTGLVGLHQAATVGEIAHLLGDQPTT
jgi:hypothetical protein